MTFRMLSVLECLARVCSTKARVRPSPGAGASDQFEAPCVLRRLRVSSVAASGDGRTLAWMLGAIALFAQLTFAEESVPSAALSPGDNLIIQNIPPVPASIAERANRYTEFRTAAVFSWHPQRREMLIGTRFADTVQVHDVKMPGGARTQLTFFPDRVSGASYHPHTRDYFVFSKDVGGGEWFQLYRYGVASREVALLTDGKSRNLGAVWSNRGDLLAYSSTRRNRADLDFYVMDPGNKATDRRSEE